METPELEPSRDADIFGAEGHDAADRAAAIGRFVIAVGFFAVGLLLLGFGAAQQNSAGAFWFVGGILAVAAAFAIPLGLSD